MADPGGEALGEGGVAVELDAAGAEFVGEGGIQAEVVARRSAVTRRSTSPPGSMERRSTGRPGATNLCSAGGRPG